MQDSNTARHQIVALENEAARAGQSGHQDEARRLWERVLALDLGHVRALDFLGQVAFRRGDLEKARELLGRLVRADGSDPQQWVNLAVACLGLKDEAGEESAIQQALAVDPSDLLALLMRGDMRERQGKAHEAARAFGAAATVAPPTERLHPDLRPSVSHAIAYKRKYDEDCAAFLDSHLEAGLREFSGADLRRFRDCVDILVGRKRRFDSQSIVWHYPRLVPIEFFDRDEFPWLEALEAETGPIRDEFLEVLRTEEGFTPYIAYPPGVPLNQWAELNHSPRWSALHLYDKGVRVEANAVRCPRTMKLLDAIPQPQLVGRTPSAMISLLKPRTRIPPHTGVTNVRLVVHVPLIIPEGCGFRVGNETRRWTPGAAWVFDDTIEHEAWNDSDQLRVILMFDVWHPHLTEPERAMLTRLAAGLSAFSGGAAGFDL